MPRPTPTEQAHYAQLVGGTITRVFWDELNGEAMPCLIVAKGGDKVVVSVLCDPEGNGVGFLDVFKEWNKPR